MQTLPKTYTKSLADPCTNIVAGMDKGMMEIFKMGTAKYWQMETGKIHSGLPGKL